MDLSDKIRSSEISIREFIDNYYRQLLTGKDIPLSQFVPGYKKVLPSIHQHLNDPDRVDLSALSYALERLPEEIFETRRIVMSATDKGFADTGLYIESGLKTGLWVKTIASRRRRRCFYHPSSGTLACYVTSPSDVDDIVNCAISFILEWQKIGRLIGSKLDDFIDHQRYNLLGLNPTEWLKFKRLIGDSWQEVIRTSKNPQEILFRYAEGDEKAFSDIAKNWWAEISKNTFIFDIDTLPVYFVSSNLHSLVNIIGGYVRQKQGEIFTYLEHNFPELYQQWQDINTAGNVIRLSDFLYYASGKYFQYNPQDLQSKKDYEASLGIKQFQLRSPLYADVQVIPVKSILNTNSMDPYIKIACPEKLSQSKALIINIDYPLGASAYYIFSIIAQTLKAIKGAYVVGKAAILSGQVGDVQIPSIVFDERTGNIYHIDNAFNRPFPFTTFQSEILQNQKAISVYNTYMENRFQLEGYIDAGFNVIEMESGPYLTAIAQHVLKENSLQSNVFQVKNLPFDFGIINYASDNPLSKNIGEGAMALTGAEPTYLALLTVLQRILDLECES
jgi:hypothetical protein